MFLLGDFIFLITINWLILLALIFILGEIYNHECKSNLFRKYSRCGTVLLLLVFFVLKYVGNAWIWECCGYLIIFFAMIFENMLPKTVCYWILTVNQREFFHLPFWYPRTEEKQRWFTVMFCIQKFFFRQILNYIIGWFYLGRRN